MVPKYEYTGTFQSGNMIVSCAKKTITKIKVNSMTQPGQQIKLYSDDADYAFVGDSASGGSSVGLGETMEAGVNLDGNADPDFVVFSQTDKQAVVFLDLQNTIMSYTPPSLPLTTPHVLWRYDGGVSNEIHANISIRSDGTTSASVSTNHLNIDLVPPPPPPPNNYAYASIARVAIAGDYDDDGDCELFLSCTGGVSSKNGMVVVNIPQNQGIITTSDLLAEIWPEALSGYDYNTGDTLFNSIHTNHENLRGWPLWNPTGSDDMLVAARGFPRLIEQFPNGANMYDIDPADFNPILPLDTDWLIVPAGKGYMIRSPD